jgi:hypothetical protein
MSSSFDLALESFRAPAPEDLEIALPPRREPKAADPVAEPELGQHGGSADGSSASSEAHGDVATSSTPEPAPQRDEPDDGEHTDSTESQIAARARLVASEDVESPEDVSEAAEEPEQPQPTVELLPEPAPTPRKEPVNVRAVLASTEGSDPRAFKRLGFSAGEDVETLTVTRFPQPAIDKLRLLLAPSLGGDFAEQISSPALITAFLVATIGVDLELDENTAAAADAFRTSDARISGVEDRLDQVASNVEQLANAMKMSLSRVADTGNLVEGMEFALAYLIADRVAGLSTTDVNETNIDVAQKKVLTARESIRKRAKAQRTIEKQQDGRRMS